MPLASKILLGAGMLLCILGVVMVWSVFHTPIEERVPGHGMVDHVGGFLGGIVIGSFGLLLAGVGVGVALGSRQGVSAGRAVASPSDDPGDSSEAELARLRKRVEELEDKEKTKR